MRPRAAFFFFAIVLATPLLVGAVSLSLLAPSHTATPSSKTEVHQSASSTSLQKREQRGILRWLRAGNSQKDIEIPPPSPLKKEVNPWNRHGVYLTSNSVRRSDFLKETMDNILKNGGSTFIFDVKGSYVYFDTTSPIAEELGLELPLYDLPAVLTLARAKGLYTMGRFIAIKDDGFTSRVPEARVRHPRTNSVISFTWVDPSHPKAIDYNMQVLCDLAKAGIDEVNLDYIRFSTEDVGALRVFSGKEKADKVEVFVKAARETIDRCNPETKLGISTYAILGWDYPVNLETLGQDVVRFASLVDVISPMAYPSTFAEGAYYNPAVHPVSRMYYLVYRTLTGYQELLGENKSKLRPWIQGYGVTEKNMRDQMQAVYDARLCGYTVWNANNNYAATYAAMAKMPLPAGCQ